MRAGLLTAAGVFALTSHAEASTWWWPEDDTAVYDTPAPPPPKRAPRKPLNIDARQEKLIEKQTAKPRGPILISVSIDEQKLRVYDANGFFAESPISTGMRGHATPMGVFSVIQKNKWHRSNIYSGAPMPYMQRVTWSGIALHAGVVPGYPASHGCIRMPNTFAIKMWGWTRMGARVIITPGDVTPTNFTHALLTGKRTPPPEAAPMASDPQKPATSSKSDKAAAAEPTAPTSGELRASILHDGEVSPVKTADASGAHPDAAMVVADVGHSASDAPAADKKLTVVAAASDDADPATTASVSKPEPAKPDAAKPQTAQSAADENTPSVNDKAPSAQAPDQAAGDAGAKDATKDAAKDQSRATEPAVAATPELPAAKRGGGQIAMFVSAKDQKLYVRQNMTPLFDVPVTIAAGERPLGTHVFTAELAKDDSVRWTVVTLPAPRRSEELSSSRRTKKALAPVVNAASEVEGPAAALDRLTIPPEAMARVAEAISTGSSLIVSDQGIKASGETGQGTDFIISLR
ncbi:L,D-transpeptidase family protein [Rhodopseudomonas sp. HC1]|uniref:L,D-transpeptidase family protein n=1 Tax=Rhodopseudomonas infernalis TaxID=2897386 RepID=UPI001EE8E798|nr:L,D-transpeptidase family protein [Rhodopseudomonas infernalis]MCG6204424.1 L,D-transpeptidase family protein [Rhodopseudomonas infernalis]